MLIPDQWLKSRLALTKGLGPVAAQAIIGALAGETEEVALLRKLEEQVRDGQEGSETYSPTEVEHLLARLDVVRCK